MCAGAFASRSDNLVRSAEPGETVLLPCDSTNVCIYYNAVHKQLGDLDEGATVIRNGIVTSKFAQRFQTDSEGLLIRDVQRRDQGTYACVDHHNHTRQIRLFVPCESLALFSSLLRKNVNQLYLF